MGTGRRLQVIGHARSHSYRLRLCWLRNKRYSPLCLTSDLLGQFTPRMASTSAAASLGSRACRTAACASARRPPIALLTPALGTHTSTSARRFHTSRPNFDHYQTLKVDRSASMKDIKNSFYQLSKKYHPDVNRNDDGAKKKFQEVSEAWSVLGEEKSK